MFWAVSTAILSRPSLVNVAECGLNTTFLFVINGANLKIIIWSHGTERPQKRENCLKLSVPESLFALSENDNVYFYFLCSRATDGDKLGSYIYKRNKWKN